MDEILEILEKDARATPEEIARMLKKMFLQSKRQSENTRKTG